MAAAAAWWRWPAWPQNFSGSSSAFGSAVAVWWQRWQQRGIGGGSVVYADDNFNCHNDDDD